MKLASDDSAFLPLLAGIGVAIASLLGISWFYGDAIIEFLKAIIIASLLFVFGLIALLGKFVVIPKPWGLILGLGCIIGAIYLVYRGGF